MLKIIMTVAALALAASGPALARSGGFVQKQGSNEWRSSKLVGTSVYGPGDQKIGDINDVLIDKSGQVRAVVIGVGGFLGVGEKNVAMPFKSLTVKRAENSDKIERISVRYSKDELKNAPAFAYYGENRNAASGSGNNTTTTGTSAASGSGASGKPASGNPNEPYTTPPTPAPKR